MNHTIEYFILLVWLVDQKETDRTAGVTGGLIEWFEIESHWRAFASRSSRVDTLWQSPWKSPSGCLADTEARKKGDTRGKRRIELRPHASKACILPLEYIPDDESPVPESNQRLQLRRLL